MSVALFIVKILDRVSETTTQNSTSNIHSFSPPALPDNMKVRKRFAQTSEEDIFTIKEKRFEEKTVKSTIWGVKIFKDWLRENDLDTDFEALLPCDLNKMLARFYVAKKSRWWVLQ